MNQFILIHQKHLHLKKIFSLCYDIDQNSLYSAGGREGIFKWNLHISENEVYEEENKSIEQIEDLSYISNDDKIEPIKFITILN